MNWGPVLSMDDLLFESENTALYQSSFLSP